MSEKNHLSSNLDLDISSKSKTNLTHFYDNLKSIENGSDSSNKQIDDPLGILNCFSSILSGNVNDENTVKFERKNPYFKINDIPVIDLIDKNTMYYENNKTKIKDYLNKIELNSNNYIDNYLTYNNCGICQYNSNVDNFFQNDYSNTYFCKNCQKNLCNNCYEKCKNQKHECIDLDEMSKTNAFNIKKIKDFLYSILIPLDNYNLNLNDLKDEDIIFPNKEEENNNDIKLIKEIILADNYKNYFHYKNIERIVNYFEGTYNIKSNNNYNGMGKVNFGDGGWGICEFKNNIPNGKLVIYDENGKLRYKGQFVIGKAEFNGMRKYSDDTYYIGKFKNNLENGKGIEYDKSGKIIYEGEYINGVREGKGKLFFNNGNYYIGEFKNNLENGKGIVYEKSGKIIYEGEYINGEREGKGQLFFNNGNYYIGEFKNNLEDGLGILYDNNNKIRYAGEYIKGKREGNGQLFYNRGIYYIGQLKDNLPNGKGIIFENSKVRYEGEFVNGEPGNYCKLINDDGSIYFGQFKDSKKSGKGLVYDKNGIIRYKGYFINDKFDGYGELIYENDNYYIGNFKNGLKHGKGIMYDKNGNIIYKGDFINGKIRG